MSDLKPNELWRAIILYGLNQATYKMALGRVLINQTALGKVLSDKRAQASVFI